jgi:hypothetical protein
MIIHNEESVEQTKRRGQMSPEAQRIAIAEACGWRPIQRNGLTRFVNPKDKSAYAEDYSVLEPHLPDYLGDLNAMHEAEKVLTDEQYTKFEDTVWELITRDGKWCNVPTAAGGLVALPAVRSRMTSPTAAQRAEAFLKTLELWSCETQSLQSLVNRKDR